MKIIKRCLSIAAGLFCLCIVQFQVVSGNSNRGLMDEIDRSSSRNLGALYDAGWIHDVSWKAAFVPDASDSGIPADVEWEIDWYYADLYRVVAGYTIRGLPYNADACELVGSVRVTYPDGKPLIGVGRILSFDVDSGEIKGYFECYIMEKVGKDVIFTLKSTLGAADMVSAIPFGVFPDQYCGMAIDEGVFEDAENSAVTATAAIQLAGLTAPDLLMFPIEQKVAQNDIMMRTFWIESTPSQTEIILSFQKPTPEIWVPGAVFWGKPIVQVDENLPVEGAMVGVLYDSDFLDDPDHKVNEADMARRRKLPDLREGERYVRLQFPVGILQFPAKLVLTVPELDPYTNGGRNIFDDQARKVTGPWVFEMELAEKETK